MAKSQFRILYLRCTPGPGAREAEGRSREKQSQLQVQLLPHVNKLSEHI